MLQWSFGCTGSFDPMTPPKISMARFAITSLAFILDCVPEPVCQTTSGKLSSNLPATTSDAAWMMASPNSLGSLPLSILACAQACLITPNARTIAIGCFSQPIGKFMMLRCVCAPQYFSEGTSNGPKLSVSVRVVLMMKSCSYTVVCRLAR